MSPKPLADSEARDRARFDLDANLAVEAGAGTGKTTLLIDRITFWLLGRPKTDPDAGLEHLVALTFTEKAAGEIKLRLQERLLALVEILRDQRIKGKDYAHEEKVLGEVGERFSMSAEKLEPILERALGQLDRAQIGTIHGFAAHLLRLYPLEAGVSPDFEVDSGERFSEMFEEAWSSWLDVELGEEAPRPELWVAALSDLELEDLRDLARKLCHEKVDLRSLWVGPERSAQLALKFDELAKRAAALASKPTKGRRLKIQDELELCREVFEELGRCLSGESVAGNRPRFSSSPGTSKSYSEEEIREYRELRRMARTANAYGHVRMERCLDLLVPFAEAFRKTYVRRGFVGFDGLLLKARDLLRDHFAIRAEVRDQFKTILIDEFQDTDPLQGELLMLLGEGEGYQAGGWKDVKLGPGRLFIVGDPKQSIYHFRGADMRAYQGFLSHMSEQRAGRLQLRTNFRSKAGLLGHVNAAFEALMQEKAGVQASYVPLAPKPDSSGGELGVTVVAHSEGGKLSAERGRQREADWIGAWISAHCGEGKTHAFRDAAILLRSTSALPFYIEALRARGIPYVVEGEKYFYGTPEVTDFLNLLRCLDDPNDALATMGLLRSPFVGLTDREIVSLATSPGGIDFRKAPPPSFPGRGRLERFFEKMRAWRKEVGRVPLADLVHRILSEGFFIELASVAYHRDQTASNLLKFLRLSTKASQEKGLTLKEFVDQIARSVRDSQEEGESPLADERVDAVRILTMHKAKGLEFPIVFLPDVTRRPNRTPSSGVIRDWGGRRVGLRLESNQAANIDRAFLESGESARAEAEELRVLYVAMTRAKEKLFLSGNDSESRYGVFSRFLSRVGLWPDRGARPDRLGTSAGAVDVKYVDPFESEEITPVRVPKAPKPVDAASLTEIWKRRCDAGARAGTAERFESPSSSHGEAEKWAFAQEEEDLGVRSDQLGTLCHALLERMDFSSPTLDPGTVEACARQVLQADSAQGNLVSEARKVLEGFVRSDRFASLQAAEILGRELPFILRRPAGAVARGVVDLLVREKGRVTVIDYKTDRIKPGEAAAAAAAKRYQKQGESYVAAVGEALGESVRFEVVFLRTGLGVSLGGSRRPVRKRPSQK